MSSRKSSALVICGIILTYGLLANRCTVQAKPFAYVVNTTGNTVSVIDTATNTVTTTVAVGVNPGSIAVHPAGTFVYVLNHGSEGVSVIDTATNTVTATVAVGVQPMGIAIHPAGTFVYVANFQSDTVSVIATATNSVTATMRVGTTSLGPTQMVVHPHGTFVYVINHDFQNLFDDTLVVIDTTTNTVTATVQLPFEWRHTADIAVHPMGTFLYLTNTVFPLVRFERRKLVAIDTTNNRIIATLEFPTSIRNIGSGSMAVHPQGTFVYTTNRHDRTVSEIDTATHTVTATVAVGVSPGSIAIHPAGTFVYVSGLDSEGDAVSEIDTATLTVTATVLVGQFQFPGQMAIHPTGTLVYVVNKGPSRSQSGTVSVINTVTNTVTATVPVGVIPGSIVIAPSAQPSISSPPVAAVLPNSRSVQVGTPATAFATLINTSQSIASGCRLAPPANVPATFTFHTTNPVTNQVTGPPDTPIDIPAGAAQSFIFALTPTGAITPTEVALSFRCTNTSPAPSIPGLNTLLLSAATTPIPDVVALAATLTNDGIVNIPGTTGTGVFAVATVNVGASGAITATADTGGISLSLSLALCQTNPTTGACLAAPASSVSTQISANATPTFGIFVTGSGLVPFAPAQHRLIVRFTDAGGVVRGATSVAVRTP